MDKTKKKTFLSYYDQAQIYDGLTDEQAGKLIKHIYKNSNSSPPGNDLLVKYAYEIIKKKIDADYDKWNEKCAKNKEIAKEGWAKRRMQSDANECERIQPDANACDWERVDATYADNDNDNGLKDASQELEF